MLRTVIPGLQVTERSANTSSNGVSAHNSLGDFNILREIGRGGMGIVYEAEQVSLGRRVALKVLLHHASASSRQRSRFQREARSAARLHHTNIVPVFGVGEEGDTDYYVMQLIQGRCLDEVLVELRHLCNASARGKHSEDAVLASRQSRNTSDIAHSLWRGDFGEAPFSEHNPTAAADPRGPKANAVESSRPATDRSKVTNGRRTIAPQLTSPSTARSSISLSLSDSHLSIAGLDSTSRDSRNTHYCDSVARIGLQVASALQYAHDHSVLHRDIKPSNLILDSSGTVWVSDFGLAKVMDQQDLTNTGDVLGTLRFG